MSGLQWLRRRSRRQLLADALVLAGLVAFVVLVYAVLVLGLGALLGHTSSPDVALSVLATAVVALAFDPVQRRLERAASRAVNQGRPSPYDVLRTFSQTVTGSYDAQELPSRMARVLADGTGAAWSQVWLVVGGRLQLAATWPPNAAEHDDVLDPSAATSGTDDQGHVRRSLPVVEAGELLGVLVVRERDHRPLSSVESRLFAGLADQAGPVLRGARLHAELSRRLEELSARAQELRISRQRLVAAQDAERRTLERNIHDGAQQHLVALAVNLRLAETLSHRSRERADALLAEQEQAAAEAIEVLVALSRGIYPRKLGADGLVPALTTAVAGSPIPVEVTATGVGRYSAGIEATAYFCCLEAVQNAAKHSGATSIRVSLDGRDGRLGFVVEDDGVGFDPAAPTTGTGLANLRDRIESAGGTLTTGTVPGGGTRIRARLPVLLEPAPVPAGDPT
jgi:signal transduction histidine kinase